ncbi:MAG TPA: PAS domain S-box protein, partial [Bacillota bacterium]|nr:PAS domain S-box protein [Bacillota bacterium]
TGREALEICKSAAPDLVLLDVNLPDLSGKDVCRAIRANPHIATTPIIHMSTTLVGTEDIVEGLEGGADACLTAPLQPRELLAQVKALLRVRQAEAELRRSEARFRALFEQNPDPFFSVDATGRFVQVNHACEEVSGYSAAELLQRNFVDICAPDQRAKTLESFRNTLQDRRCRKLETALIGKNGRRVELLITGSPVVIEPAANELYCTAMDITDRKRMENALRQKESEVKEAQRLAHIGNWHWDAQSDLMTGSEEIQRIFGLDPSNPICVPWHAHRGRLWPAEEWDRVNFAMQHALQTGQPYELDVQVLHPDGTRVWVVARGEPVRNAEGRIVGLRGTLQDITERKLAEEVLRESERRLRQFIEHAPVSLAMFDRQMRYLAVSQSWQEQFAPGQPSLIGQCHYELWPDMPQNWKAAHRRGLAGEVVTCDEDAFIGRSNTPEWTRWEVRPWQAPDGAIGGIVIMTENITRRKQAEEALRRSEHQFRVLAESIPQLIWTTNPEGQADYVNERWSAYTGQTPEQAYGSGWAAAVHPEDRPRVIESWSAAW